MRWAGDALPRCAGNRNLLSLCTSHLTILLVTIPGRTCRRRTGHWTIWHLPAAGSASEQPEETTATRPAIDKLQQQCSQQQQPAAAEQPPPAAAAASAAAANSRGRHRAGERARARPSDQRPRLTAAAAASQQQQPAAAASSSRQQQQTAQQQQAVNDEISGRTSVSSAHEIEIDREIECELGPGDRDRPGDQTGDRRRSSRARAGDRTGG